MAQHAGPTLSQWMLLLPTISLAASLAVATLLRRYVERPFCTTHAPRAFVVASPTLPDRARRRVRFNMADAHQPARDPHC
jgi:peptidoglycan/LPS O-acetylase OafA/YrhL